MRLYDTETGYANMPEIITQPFPYILCVGGRGTGKTYGTLKFLLENHILFIYLRRTSAQMELIAKSQFSPIVQVGHDIGMELQSDMVGKYSAVVTNTDGEAVAYVMALSTIASIRSFDASSVEILVYDECVPEVHERTIKHESTAILQCIETCGRNREIQGKDPLKVVFLANANNFSAPVFDALGAIAPLELMRNKHLTQWHSKTRGLSIVMLNDSPISAEKRDTALYRLTAGDSEFAQMALDNAFSNDNFEDVTILPINEFSPLYGIPNTLCVYRHKSKNLYYVTDHFSGNPEIFDATKMGYARFRARSIKCWESYYNKNTKFQNAVVKAAYIKIMENKM